METFEAKNEELTLIKSDKVYLDGDGIESLSPLNSGENLQDWIYKVDKRSNDWILTVQYPYTIMLHTSPLYYPCVEYYLLPNTQQLIIHPGQWCEMIYNGYWSLMTDADHR